MRRIARWMFNWLTVLSLVMCAYLAMEQWHATPYVRVEQVGDYTIFFQGSYFTIFRVTASGNVGTQFVSWKWLTLLAALPFLRLAAWGWERFWPRETRFPSCVKCGYNLTGNVSGVCPECGTMVAAQSGQIT